VLFGLPGPNEKIKVAIVIGDPEPLGEVIGPYGGAVALVYAGRYAGRCIRRVLPRSGPGKTTTQRTVWPSTIGGPRGDGQIGASAGIEGNNSHSRQPPDDPRAEIRSSGSLLIRITITFEAHPYAIGQPGQSIGIRIGIYTGAMFQRWEGKPQGVRRRPSDVVPAFEWLRTEEGWDYLAELIDDLVKSTSPGHQYLSAYPREDAIVVVSKGEYGDEVLEYLDNPS
jgi:hypothetical protein